MLEILTQWAQIAWNWNTCAIYLQLNEIFQGFVWFTLFDNDTMHISAPWPTIIDRAERKNGGNGHSIITTQTSEKSLKHLRESCIGHNRSDSFHVLPHEGHPYLGSLIVSLSCASHNPLGVGTSSFQCLKLNIEQLFCWLGWYPTICCCLLITVWFLLFRWLIIDPDCWRRRIRGSLFKAFAWVERPKNTNYFSHSVY